MIERPTHVERLQRATVSSNLSVRAGERRDTDYLVASGFMGRKIGSTSLVLIRAGGTTPGELRAAMRAVREIAARMNSARRWGLSDDAAHAVADLALAFYIHPACPHCNGRKYQAIPGTPALSDRACTHCKGTGEKPFPRKHRDQIEAVLSMLRGCEEEVSRRINALMR